MRVAKTKKEAILYKIEEIEFTYEKNTLNTIYLFLNDIGAKRTIPTETKQATQQYIIRLHEALTVLNPRFREDLFFDEVYPLFFMDVIYERAQRNGNNISSLCICFNKWLSDNSQKFKEEEQKLKKEAPSTPVESFDDNTLSNLYQIITKLYGYNEIGLKNLDGMDKFTTRVINEYKSRFG